MVDIIRAIKNVLDVHGAWVFGGTLAAGLIAHKSRKQKSLDAEWDYVQCIGCGRGGYSDEMKSAQDASGKDHYTCARCSRPDLFKQAEATDAEIILMQAILSDGTVAETSIDHVDQISWPGHLLDESAAKGGSMAGRFEGIEMPAGSGHHCVVWSDSDATEPNAEASRLAGQPVFGTAVVYSVYGGESFAAEATNPCQHCDGAGGFPREFYYQPDRIEMIPCGTCLTQGRCPGCMEIYPSLSRDNTPEDVFFGSGCDRCGYSESDAREARKTARRWVELVDNPGAAKFMAEGGHPSIDDDYYQLKNHKCPRCGLMVTESDSCGGQCAQCWACGCDCDAILATKIITEDDHDYEVDDYILIVDGSIREVSGNSEMDYLESNNDWDQYQIAIITGVKPYVVEIATARYGNQTRDAEEDDLEICNICGDRTHTDTVEIQVCEKHTASDYGLFYPDHWEGDAEDYGVRAVWMADAYDPAIHGNTIPTGSVKRFLEKIPVGQMFHVDFVKSNGDIREMEAFFNKPYHPDSITANVMERTATGAVFKRFRVDRVVGLYRI